MVNKKQKRAIVTGGCGFIGSHLTDLLLANGFKVTVLDNFSTGNPGNLEHQKSNKNLEIVQTDVSDYDDMEKCFRHIDIVFHLAALADIVPSIEKPQDYHRANVDGTVNVLIASQKHCVKKLVYSASSSCYGIPDSFPTKETDDIRPQYPYALTKFIGECYVLHWGKVYGLPVISLRLFNVFGKRSRTSGAYGAVFGVFLKQKLAGKPFTIVGDGTQTRDFIYVTDVANAFLAAGLSDVKNEVFNVGSGNTYSVNLLVDLLKGERIHIPKRPGEPDCTQADVSKIKKMLGWKAEVDFKDGVDRVLEDIHYWDDAPLWDEETIKYATKKWFKYLK